MTCHPNRLDRFVLLSKSVAHYFNVNVCSCNFQACCLSPSSTTPWLSLLWCFSTFTTHSLTTAQSTRSSSASTLSSASSSPSSPSYLRYRYSVDQSKAMFILTQIHLEKNTFSPVWCSSHAKPSFYIFFKKALSKRLSRVDKWGNASLAFWCGQGNRRFS